MRPLLIPLWHYLRAFSIIWAALLAGNGVASLLPIKLPGSILGMLILFLLLCLQWIPVHWVKPGCVLFIRYMVLLFVPVSIGIMSYMDTLMAQFGPIVVSCILSTTLVFVITGLSAEHLRKKADGEHHDV
ncbi:murein hydrolase regulator LrgA [Enterobacterales bacterium CwR94]|nr:murein hydrolase regulator LrgA [Enterobacterales bacterium CwR94]